MSTDLILHEYALAEYSSPEQFITASGKLIIGIPHSEAEEGVVLLLPYYVVPKTHILDALRPYNSSPVVLFHTACLESRSPADGKLEYRYLSEILARRQGDMIPFFCMGEETINEYCRRRIHLEEYT